MTGFRRLLLDRYALSAWVIGCALLMRILVPTGFMPVMTDDGVTIRICGGTRSSTAGTPVAAHAAMPVAVHAAMPVAVHAAMPGMAHPGDTPDHPQGGDAPCAFSALAAPALAAADAVLLAAAIAFIIATTARVAPPGAVRQAAFLRPPLRGPPAHA